jgi:hypothetical protein
LWAIRQGNFVCACAVLKSEGNATAAELTWMNRRRLIPMACLMGSSSLACGG